MRYVIVSIVKGPAGDFNNNLRKDIFSKYKAKSSKLPAHFTIKAPFEYNENITDLENCIEEISKKEKATPYKIDGYNHFDDRVIYMDVNMSKEAKKVHDELIDKLSTISYINFKNNEGKDKIFHVTLSSKKIQKIYKQLWDYVNTIPCFFDCMFDNICIYKWQNNTWVLHREYKLEN